MDCHAGLDGSLRSVAICAIGGDGQTVLERTVACEFEDIATSPGSLPALVKHVGFEAGAVSQHLFFGLKAPGFDVICMEARQVNAALSAMRNSAANAMMMRAIAGSEIKSWGPRLMPPKGRRRAVVAVAG